MSKFTLFVNLLIGISTIPVVADSAGATSAPTLSDSGAAELVNLENAYIQEKDTLDTQRSTLVAQGATDQQIEAWEIQHATNFAAQKARAEGMALITGLQIRSTTRTASIPNGASQTLIDFLMARTALINARAAIHNGLVQQLAASGKTATFADLLALQEQEGALFEQQNATVLANQAIRAKVLTAVLESQVQPVPPVIDVPIDVSPQLAAYMRTRNQYIRLLVTLKNQYVSATTDVRDAALQAFQQQNAALITQMQQQAAALAQQSQTSN